MKLNLDLSKNCFTKRNLVIFEKLLNLILILSGLFILWLSGKILFWASFSVPSASMEPAILAGDQIVVYKPWLGPRILNPRTLLNGKQPEVYRIPGFQQPERNDILVFNNPHKGGNSNIEMDFGKYYIKRCIGLPGDTLSIQEGRYKVNGFSGILGYLPEQEKLAAKSGKELLKEKVWKTYPDSKLLNWTIKSFGPLVIPREGIEIEMNHINYLLYKPLIEWESKGELHFSIPDSVCYLNDCKLLLYKFRSNYYFMAGDQVLNSEDSRFLGPVPEQFIVGKAAFVLKSYDSVTKSVRKDRFFKKIN